MNTSELEALCRRIAPQDTEGPLYVVLASQSPERYRTDGVGGYCGPDIDLAFRDELKAARRWRGRGRCFFVDDITIGDQSRQAAEMLTNDLGGDDLTEFRNELFRNRITNVALHEFTHSLNFGAPQSEEPEHSQVIEIQSELEQWSEAGYRAHEAAMSFPWQGHDYRFIRTLVHVERRAARLGVKTIDNVMFGSWAYGVSNLHQYRLALGSDTDTEASFAEIQETPPNAEFMNQWRDDVLLWIDRRSGSSKFESTAD